MKRKNAPLYARKTIFLFFLLFSFIFIAASCPAPKPPDPPQPPDPPIIEYEEYDICIDSNKLRNTDCPPDRIERRRFEKDSPLIPTEWCDFHKAPDPPYIYPEKIEDIHAGFLGIYLWYLNKGWTPSDEPPATEDLAATLHEIRDRQIGTIDFFLWVSDGQTEHTHLNQKTPFLPLPNGGFDLANWQPRYFELFEIFVIECKAHDIRPAPHLFMDRYNYGPFENNINGVTRFWTDEAFYFQKQFAEKICQILEKYFSDYWIKPINEAAHYGDAELFHRIGAWHRDLWGQVLNRYIPIRHLILDSSMSEGVFMYLIDVTACPKPRADGSCDAGHGNPDYDRADPYNSVLPESHTITTYHSLVREAEPGVNAMIGIENSKWTRLKFHGDGGDDGNFQLGNTSFRQGDAAETYEMAFYLWTRAKHKSKQAIYSVFPMEAFDMTGTGWMENYTASHIFWDRLDALVRAWKDVYN